MHDLSRINNTIKKVALNAVENSKPVNIMFGTVTRKNPLEIDVEQRLLLGINQLILTKNVTGLKKHENTSKVHDLEVNDEVILLRKQGGQKYVVLDWTGW